MSTASTVPTAPVAPTDDVAWLDDDELPAWRAFVETVFELNGALEADLAGHGLTLGDYQVFVHLSEADDRAMRMCDLAGLLQLSPSGLTRRLDGLVRRGDIARVPARHDRRVMLAVLTDQGMTRLAEAAPTHVGSVRRRIFDHIEPADVAALRRIFGAVQAALHAGDDGNCRNG